VPSYTSGSSSNPAAQIGEHQLIAALPDHQRGQLVGQHCGEGTSLPSLLVCSTRPSDSVTDRDTFIERRNRSKILDTQRGHLAPAKARVREEPAAVAEVTVVPSTASYPGTLQGALDALAARTS
jgi:hypothetical protein